MASNFREPIQAITALFEEQTGHKVILSFGSTGKHYAQIRNGAPFDVFFAADKRRPQLMEQEGIGVPDSRFTYALGRLVLWSPLSDYVDPEGDVLARPEFHHLAIANPKLAPYGKAAREVLEALGLWDELQPKLVRGENIGQTFHFVKTGNAELGFVATSQVMKNGIVSEGSHWEIPRALYHPIEQQAILLNDIPAAHEFMRFVKGDEARTIIQEFGYDLP